ncbi:MAG TPA: AAA family ATPase [Polyangiaceae bacterium]|nr:AAA family ATPase [Polyangiaceae bacterium]
MNVAPRVFRTARGALWLLAALLLTVLTVAPGARALDGGAPDGGTETAPEEPSPGVDTLRQNTEHIHAFTKGKLDVAVDPKGLFDVPLDDDATVELEARRLGTLLREIDAPAPAPSSGRGAAPKGRDRPVDAGALKDAGSRASELWEARIKLDRARLSFYSLPSARRRELLAQHAKRQAEAAPPPSEAELLEQRAAEERARAVLAAQQARSEAERLVSEELTRMLDVERAQRAFDQDLTKRREELEARLEATLGAQRKARELREKGEPSDVDTGYDALRKTLATSRAELAEALDDLGREAGGAPAPGPTALANLPPTVDAGPARAARARAVAYATRLDGEQQALREERATQLFAEIGALNVERLALLPHLTAGKREAVTGFGEQGVDHVTSELRQLALIVRYHRHAAGRWVSSLGIRGKASGQTLGRSLLLLFEWLGAILAFVWLRKRTPEWLAKGRERALELDRHERLTSPSIGTRAFSFALDVHKPVEWLALALVMAWMLPDSAADVLEVELVAVTVQWFIGGALVVDLVNALAGEGPRAAARDDDTPALRLKSLRLVGRVVVVFGLILTLSTKLVGQGTIHRWVLSTCWFASVPVALVLVRWWREVVFARAARARRESPFERWVLANQRGWKSLFAASAGAAYLFGRGAIRGVRSWVGRYGVTRRVLAYLFRRQLDKLSAERTDLATTPIPDDTFDALGPDTASKAWVKTETDEAIEALLERIRSRRGGVVAVVGQRGMGKTALLRHLHEEFPDTLRLRLPAEGIHALRGDLAEALGADPSTSLEHLAAALNTSERGRALLLDDVQRFIQPVMGGLAPFDALLDLASRHCTKTTWVLALDDVIWLFLQRARGARPLFDRVIRLSPWPEEQIIELLHARTEQVALAPSFEHLREDLPPNADEIDKQDALARCEGNYYRLLWDYAAGNPGVALHMWRRSLGLDAEGVPHVRFFQAPDTTELEALPDPAVFVLRAVMQLAPATTRELGEATMLSAADVADALRFALAHGYVAAEDERYVITWAWFRPIVLFLQRRHLLVT